MVGGSDCEYVRERIDRSCDLLRSACRRHVVYALRADGPATVAELADALVASGVADDRRRAVASLVHTHLPKLADSDVVTYDDPSDEVALGDGVADLEPFLTAAAHRESRPPSDSGAEDCPVAAASDVPD